jgi:hypothetical protein
MKHDLEAVKRLGFRSMFPVTPTQMKQCMLFYAKGVPANEAAKRSGVPLPAFKLYLEQDNFAADLRAVVKGLVETQYAPLAFAFLNECVIDTAMPARVRVDAAKAILDRSGYVAAPLAADRDPGDITGMSREELHRFVKEAEAKLASEAKDVSPSSEAPGEDESDGAALLADDTPPQPH